MKRLVLFLCGILLACSADFSGGNAYAQQLPRYGKRVHPKLVAEAPCVTGKPAIAVRLTTGTPEENATDAAAIASMTRSALQLFDVLHIENPRVTGRRARLNAALR